MGLLHWSSWLMAFIEEMGGKEREGKKYIPGWLT
jgi:hypothetical protein